MPKVKIKDYITTIAIVFWKDASIHGRGQFVKEDWMDMRRIY